jgi:hypothetical protein
MLYLILAMIPRFVLGRSGLVVTALLLTGFCGLVVVGLVLAVFEKRRIRNRKRRNLCIECGYPRGDLDYEAPCNECGASSWRAW